MSSGGKAYVKGLRVDAVNRDEHDFYPTNPVATRALLAVETFDGPIWEPACGEGDMSKVFEEAGYPVISTDLIDRGYGEGGVDFLRQWKPRAPNIVTNPPFKLAVQFINVALTLSTGKVAMLLRLAFLEGQRRKMMFERTPLARVYTFSRRVPMQRGRIARDGEGHGQLAFAWLVWEHGFQGDPTTHFIDWKDA